MGAGKIKLSLFTVAALFGFFESILGPEQLIENNENSIFVVAVGVKKTGRTGVKAKARAGVKSKAGVKEKANASEALINNAASLKAEIAKGRVTTLITSQSNNNQKVKTKNSTRQVEPVTAVSALQKGSTSISGTSIAREATVPIPARNLHPEAKKMDDGSGNTSFTQRAARMFQNAQDSFLEMLRTHKTGAGAGTEGPSLGFEPWDPRRAGKTRHTWDYYILMYILFACAGIVASGCFIFALVGGWEEKRVWLSYDDWLMSQKVSIRRINFGPTVHNRLNQPDSRFVRVIDCDKGDILETRAVSGALDSNLQQAYISARGMHDKLGPGGHRTADKNRFFLGMA